VSGVPEGDDWLLRFLSEFATMSEQEREAAIDALPAARQQALIALADVRAEAARTDLLAVLDEGHGGLDRLYRVTDPAELYAAIRLAAAENPALVVEALFAAVVAHRSWAPGEPEAIVSLREQWIWHIHEQIQAGGEGSPTRGEPEAQEPSGSGPAA
jgi:hypothetical protein